MGGGGYSQPFRQGSGPNSPAVPHGARKPDSPQTSLYTLNPTWMFMASYKVAFRGTFKGCCKGSIRAL